MRSMAAGLGYGAFGEAESTGYQEFFFQSEG